MGPSFIPAFLLYVRPHINDDEAFIHQTHYHMRAWGHPKTVLVSCDIQGQQATPGSAQKLYSAGNGNSTCWTYALPHEDPLPCQ